MAYSNIKLNPERSLVVIQPLKIDSDFSTETKKYERKAVGKVVKTNAKLAFFDEGDIVIYDDSNSVDFVRKGETLSIVEEYDVLATYKGE